jgi:hypothetical protein
MLKRQVWLPILLVVLFVLGGGLVLQGQVAHALPPAQQPAAGVTIPYPGHLADVSGATAADGAYTLAFALYDSATDGQPLWSETQEGVAVKGGAFLVTLGSVQPLPAAALAGSDLWLEVAVRGPADAGFTTLAPRQQLSQAQPGAGTNQAAPCAHTHFGETWAGTGVALALEGNDAGEALYVTNANSTSGDGIRIYNHAPDSAAIWANNLAAGFGVHGYSSGGVGVFGTSGAGDGVAGESAVGGKSGVYGHQTGDASNLGFGVTGRSDNFFGVLAWGNDASLMDTTGDLLLQGTYGEIFAEGDAMDLYSNGDVFVDLDNNNDGTNCFKILDGADNTLWQQCETKGTLSQGPQASVAQTADYGSRAFYSVQSPEVWLEDYGTAGLADGAVTVAIDPVFAQAANTQQEYHVYVTALSEEPVLLYVTAKTPTGFTVRGVTMDGKPAACSFDYRVVAKQLGHESTRLEQVDLGGK